MYMLGITLTKIYRIYISKKRERDTYVTERKD